MTYYEFWIPIALYNQLIRTLEIELNLLKANYIAFNF